ncbi:MAG: hypothetical protein GXP22_03995 [Gammaproteobacteria bacterium]|nr:hypothetical protein [Gammaproteobacteria bacterium]
MNSLYILLHVIAAVIWVGGMIFAHRCLRPVVAELLDPPQRLKLWVGVFNNFFPLVWLSIILLLSTGYLMTYSIWQGFSAAPLYVHLMAGLGILMVLIYMHVFFSPYKKLKEAVITEQWPNGGEAIAQIRTLIGINSLLGLLVIAIASGGRYFI